MSEELTIRKQLDRGLPASTFTKGVSMQPLLYEGKTHVILEPLRRELRKGELPIYQRPDGVYVIHRLIRSDEEHYYTRGDNCVTYEKIPKDWAIGLVTEIYGRGKPIHVTDLDYRIYVQVWMAIYPLRWLYKQTKWKIEGLWARIKKHETEKS